METGLSSLLRCPHAQLGVLLTIKLCFKIHAKQRSGEGERWKEKDREREIWYLFGYLYLVFILVFIFGIYFLEQ